MATRIRISRTVIATTVLSTVVVLLYTFVVWPGKSSRRSVHPQLFGDGNLPTLLGSGESQGNGEAGSALPPGSDRSPDGVAAAIDSLTSKFSGAELSLRLQQLAHGIDVSDWDTVVEFWSSLPPGRLSEDAFRLSVSRLAKSHPIESLQQYGDTRSLLTDKRQLILISKLAEHAVRSGKAAEAYKIITDQTYTTDQDLSFGLGMLFHEWSEASPSAALASLSELPSSPVKDDIVTYRLTNLDEYVRIGEAMPLIDEIENVGLRRSFIDKIAAVYSRVEPSSGMEQQLASEAESAYFRASVFEDWTKEDNNAALGWLSAHFDEIDSLERDEWISSVISTIAQIDEGAGYAWAEQIVDAKRRQWAVTQLDAAYGSVEDAGNK